MLALDRYSESGIRHSNGEKSLIQGFNTYFSSVSADTLGSFKAAFALRYQVYCIERQFEDPAQQSKGLESDAFDRHSIHSLLIYRPRQEVIGTARLILPLSSPQSLPIQQLLRTNGTDSEVYFPNETVGEVSRFAISKEFRRRVFQSSACGQATGQTRIRGNLPFLGLVQEVLRQSIDVGIEHWAAIMEPQLLRLLASIGIIFRPIGPLISYHGLRQPSYCHIPQVLHEMERTHPDNWAVVSNGGDLTYQTTKRRSSTTVVADSRS